MGPPPTMMKAQLSADGKMLQLVKSMMVPTQYTVTKKVPETVTVEKDGKVVAETRYREVSETATRMVCASVCEPVDLQRVELRSAAGGHYEAADLSRLVGTEATPVIVLQRRLEIVNGQTMAKTVDFDRSFLEIFKPETLVLILPPPAGVPASPAGVPMIHLPAMNPPVAAPVVNSGAVPAPVVAGPQ
jgi:hypothetical protein